jgi:F5/8 type C domain
MSSNRYNHQAPRALDGDPTTKWATNRIQTVGDWVEFTLDAPREIAALDFTHNTLTFDTPAAFKLEVSEDGEHYQKVFERPRIRFYFAQVYRPSSYVFRVVLQKPVLATRLKLTVLEAMPRRWMTIYEAHVWVTKQPHAAITP